MVNVKRKGLKTDCRGNIRTIRANVCDHSLVARDNHALIHMLVKTETFDKIMINVILIMLDGPESLPCLRPMCVD